ncbi:MAG: ABC transporter permease, partial [Bacteroidota bacterium]
MKPTPPSFALRFLRWFCREDFIEEIEGDLIEVFENQYNNNPKKGKRKFSWSVLRYFRPEFIKVFKLGQNSTAMIQHNLKLTLRNFRKYKSSFFINLIGLSSGLVCALMIYLWVADELSIDKFHEKDDRLFQVMHNVDNPTEITTIEWTPAQLTPTFQNEMPEVEYVVPLFPPSAYTFSSVLNANDTRMKGKMKYVGKDFFNLFSFRLIAGEADNVFADKQAIVISEEIALGLFKTKEDVLGKTIKLEQSEFDGDYYVTGIFEKIDDHSTMHFDILFDFDLYRSKNPDLDRWSYNSPSTYFSLNENASSSAFENKIADIIKEHDPESKSTLFLRKYSDQHLYGNYENGVVSGGRIDYVILFSYIAGFILIIACINFINLSTARASRRFKEIGVKKCIGARRSILIGQYLGESLIMSVLSVVTALVLIYLLLPVFNDVTGKHLTLAFDKTMILYLLAITFVTGLVAGSYPALYLSGFNPIYVLKGGKDKSGFSGWIRKGLVTFQFTISIILIVMVIIVQGQIDFIQSKNLGFNKDNVVNIFGTQVDETKRQTTLAEIQRIPGVLGATSLRGDFTNGLHNRTVGVDWEGKVEGAEINFDDLVVDHNFFATMGIDFVEGQSFSSELESDRQKIIFNETAIEQMGLEDPIGQTVNLWGQDKQIVGVVKDFHIESLYKKVQPALFRIDDHHLNILVKINAGREREVVDQIQAFYKEQSNGLALDYEFLDETFQR